MTCGDRVMGLSCIDRWLAFCTRERRQLRPRQKALLLPSPAADGEQISDMVKGRICMTVWTGFVPSNVSSFRAKADAISDQRYELALRLCDEGNVSRPS